MVHLVFQLFLHLLAFIQPLTVCVLSDFSWVRLFATLWTIARQALLSVGFSRQEYWSWLPFTYINAISTIDGMDKS